MTKLGAAEFLGRRRRSEVEHLDPVQCAVRLAEEVHESFVLGYVPNFLFLEQRPGFRENGLSILRRVVKGCTPLNLLPFALCLPSVPERVLEESVRDGGRFGFLPGLWILGSL